MTGCLLKKASQDETVNNIFYQEQFYFYVDHHTTDLLKTGCSIIFNLNDESIAVVPSIVYNIFENVDLTFFGNFYFGRSGTTYASNMGNGALARARVYF